jgi:hypothetical protein
LLQLGGGVAGGVAGGTQGVGRSDDLMLNLDVLSVEHVSRRWARDGRAPARGEPLTEQIKTKSFGDAI